MIAGRINKLFGTGGGLRLTLYESFPEEFDPETTPLIVKIDGLDVPLWCERFACVGASGADVRFADIDTERRAEELIGREFRIEPPKIGSGEDAAEAADDEFYLEDLIGFAVEADGRRGTLTDYYDSEANPLFELEIDGRSLLVPAVEEFIAHIDFEGRTIKMVLPDGLLDLA